MTDHNYVDYFRTDLTMSKVCTLCELDIEEATSKCITTRCGNCGTLTDGFHSGDYECGPCWDWRKLDGPAASYWSRVTHEFLKQVDMHDVMTYLPTAVGSKREAYAMLDAVQHLLQYSEAQLCMTSAQRAMGPQGPNPDDAPIDLRTELLGIMEHTARALQAIDDENERDLRDHAKSIRSLSGDVLDIVNEW